MMDMDFVVCPYCGNAQDEDCDGNADFICDECDRIFDYKRPSENE